MTLKDELKKVTDAAAQYRDEAKVRLHLARQDAKDEWDDLEKHWETYRQKLDAVAHEAGEGSQDARRSAKELGEKLKERYDRLRKRLQ